MLKEYVYLNGLPLAVLAGSANPGNGNTIELDGQLNDWSSADVAVVPGFPIFIPPVAMPGTPENQSFVEMVTNALPGFEIECIGGTCFPVPSYNESDDGDCPVPGTSPGKKTRGPSNLKDKEGDFSTANDDFDDLNLSGIKNIPGGGRVGTLPDGRNVVVRPNSSDGRPTIEVQSGRDRIKIRYGR